MCYNIAYIEKRAAKYFERYGDMVPEQKNLQQELFDHVPQYYFVSGFTNPALPVVKEDGIALYNWGLIPSWTKDAEFAGQIRNRTLNAVGETVFKKPSFRAPILKKRCLLGVNGFYEWRDFKGKKYPYLISVRGDELFSLGCIYENWTDKETGEMFNTFTIITTPANPLLEKIHNLKKRMPLIIPREKEAMWISSETETEDIRNTIVPFDEKKMQAHTVTRKANSSKNNRNVPEIMEEVVYEDLDE